MELPPLRDGFPMFPIKIGMKTCLKLGFPIATFDSRRVSDSCQGGNLVVCAPPPAEKPSPHSVRRLWCFSSWGLPGKHESYLVSHRIPQVRWGQLHNWPINPSHGWSTEAWGTVSSCKALLGHLPNGSGSFQVSTFRVAEHRLPLWFQVIWLWAIYRGQPGLFVKQIMVPFENNKYLQMVYPFLVHRRGNVCKRGYGKLRNAQIY